MMTNVRNSENLTVCLVHHGLPCFTVSKQLSLNVFGECWKEKVNVLARWVA